MPGARAAESTYSTPCVEDTNHPGAESISQSANIRMMHAMFGGSPPTHLDILGGQGTMVIDSLQPTLPHIHLRRLCAPDESRTQGIIAY